MTKKTRAKARRALLTLSLVLVMMVVAVGGTIAWLTDSTDPVTNTFSPSTVKIELDETTGDEYKMLPNVEIDKDPYVKVETGSEKCYVFVKITEENNLDHFINYEVASDWDEVEENVYYRIVDAADQNTELYILTDNKVQVNANVTESDMEALNDANEPKLSFIAYAVQYEELETTDIAEIWALAQTQGN